MTILTSYEIARRFRISSILRATDVGNSVAERKFECNLRSRQTLRKIVWVLSLATLIVVLSGCGGGGGSIAIAPSDPPPRDSLPTDLGGRVSETEQVPATEEVVAFPASQDTQSPEYRIRREEIDRVLAMHRRGGTGAGQIVGIFDSGANESHPDLGGQFAHVCAMGNCDEDNRPELNRGDGGPLQDTVGHGTSVNGVVAAKKNGQGVIGIAYQAKIASYGNNIGTTYPWGNDCWGSIVCPAGLSEKDHLWGPEFDKQTARGIDWMRNLGVGATNMSWGRTFPWPGIPKFNQNFYREDMMPLSLPAFEKYVEAGGVVVWAAGNGRAFHPAMENMLPRYFPHLEKGWLTVVGFEPDGHFSDGSYKCGVAADWCIAAPMVLLTTERNGQWRIAGGTSIAAPYVTGSLAALKSMFPNLSYQQIRDRIFRTADKTGQYSNRLRFGQGRLNLDAASSPVDGTNFALGTFATGPVSSTTGTQLTLPRQAIEQNLNGQFTLVFDGYQRAPFKVGLDSFAEPRGSYLSMADLSLTQWQQRHEKLDGRTSITASDGNFEGFGLREGRSFVGFGRGAGVMRGLARLGGAPLPSNNYRMSKDAAGVALRFDNGFGIWHASLASGAAKPGTPGFGVSSWHPKTVVTTSFVPKRSGKMTRAQAFGISFASGLKRPMGWHGSGALELKGDSVEFGWRRNIAANKAVRVDLTNRVTRLALQGGPLLRFDDALLGSMGIAISFLPSSSVTLETQLGVERLIAPFTGSIRTAASVDESGRIAYRDVAIDGRELLSFDKAVVRVGIKGRSNSYYSVGVAAVRDGFGSTASLAGFQMESKF